MVIPGREGAPETLRIPAGTFAGTYAGAPGISRRVVGSVSDLCAGAPGISRSEVGALDGVAVCALASAVNQKNAVISRAGSTYTGVVLLLFMRFEWFEWFEWFESFVQFMQFMQLQCERFVQFMRAGVKSRMAIP
jgi:hypothetical protein